MEVFDQIKKDLEKQRNLEFKKYNVTGGDKIIVKINKEDLNKVSYDVRKFTAQNKKQQYLSSLKGNNTKEYDIGNDLINMETIQDNVERKGWSSLKTPEKKLKIKDFLDKLDLKQELYDVIVNKRIYKKDVEYNIFSSSVEKLNFLKLEDGVYKIIKKKTKKKNQKIFK